nr:family 20 glycosylhydrolase [Clostridiales bacterium]
LSDRLKKNGKKAVTWNESLKGGNLNGDITVQFWLDNGGKTKKKATDGRDIILSDFYRFYLDYPYGMTPLKKTYNSDGVIKQFGDRVIGLEAELWTEYIRDFDRLCYMGFPRLIAVAERAWTGDDICVYDDFKRRLRDILPTLPEDIKYADESEWDKTIVKRAAETVSFFAAASNSETVKSLINSARQKNNK